MTNVKVIRVIIAAVLILAIAVGGAAIINHFNKVSFEILKPPDFGGRRIAYWNFSKDPGFYNSSGSIWLAENIKVVSKNLKFDTAGEQFNLYVDEDSYNGSTLEPFVIFGYNLNTRLESFSTYMIDVDITIPGDVIYRSVSICPDFRNDSYVLCNKSNYTLEVIGHDVYFADALCHILDSDTFHLTYVISSEGKGIIYINGKYINVVEKIFTSGCTYIDGLKLSTIIDQDGAATYSVDNFQIHAFSKKYKGAINDLYETPWVDLSTCSDSILFDRSAYEG